MFALGAFLAWITPLHATAIAATGERSVSDVRISLGEEGRRWTLVPTMLEGSVESFLALRQGLACGENLTAVWYRRVAIADGTQAWETKGFVEQDQSKVVRAVKESLALSNTTDASWPVAIAPVPAPDAERMTRGILESDPLAPLITQLENPRPLVEMLEAAGWKAAWIDPLEEIGMATADPSDVECSATVVLDAMASAIETSGDESLATALDSIAQSIMRCRPWCIPATVETAGPWGPWNCGSAAYVLVDCDRQPVAGCVHHCNYVKRIQRTQFRSVGRIHIDCTTTITMESRTEYYESNGVCQRSGFMPPGCQGALFSNPCPTGAPCNPQFNGSNSGICSSDALACPPTPSQETETTDWQ